MNPELESHVNRVLFECIYVSYQVQMKYFPLTISDTDELHEIDSLLVSCK